MVPDRQKIMQAVFEAIDETNQQLPEEQRLQKSESTVLFGEASVLDSLGLVSLIVAIEQKMEDFFDISVTLADEKAMSLKNSPFRTVDTLLDYISTILSEE